MYHEPVMLKEVMEYLDPRPGATVVDATMGGGGYTVALARAVGDTGRVIAFDADPLAIAHVRQRLAAEGIANVTIVHDNFGNLQTVLESETVPNIDGIAFDLGLSSAQLKDPARGFGFTMADSLDMSFAGDGVTTAALVNAENEETLQMIIAEYGEERYAGRIARAIVAQRPFASAHALSETIAAAVPAAYRHGRIHPATRTFQALRIATNRELERLASALSQARDALSQGGRLVAVSYHSLEDRIVKRFFRDGERACVCPPEQPACACAGRPTLKRLTKKAVLPSEEEVKRNPRARSAKLRAAEKL